MTTDILADFRAVITASGGNAYVSNVGDLPALFRELQVGGAVWLSPDVPADIAELLQSTDLEVHTDPHPEATRDQPWGVAMARAAISETGSVILHENRLQQRSVSLMTDALIVLCPLDQLLPSLDDAAKVLREIAADGNSYATLVSGPSRTADIERQLTLGVQGPAALHVVFVKD